jgi:hypothetical protein
MKPHCGEVFQYAFVNILKQLIDLLLNQIVNRVLFTSSIISLGLCAARPVKPSCLAPALSDTELHHMLALLQWHILSMYFCSPACLQMYRYRLAMHQSNPISVRGRLWGFSGSLMGFAIWRLLGGRRRSELITFG